MNRNTRLLGICILFLIGARCFGQQTVILKDSLILEGRLLFKEGFENTLKNWAIEQQDGGSVIISDGKMEITDVGGCTVWYKHQLQAPLLIEYDAIVIDQDGKQDRVSDLNCFWLATDPEHPDNFLMNSEKRKGKFGNYDSLRLYYVGLGGHHNTRTRLRKYDGTGKKPLLPEHDLSAEKFLIRPNETNHIKIVAYQGIIQYYRNNLLIYDIMDLKPYTEGYFGLRTVNNRMTVDNFKVYTLSESK